MSVRFGQFQLANDLRVRSIVEAAMMFAGQQILAENPETPNHGNRAALAATLYTPEATNRKQFIDMMVWRVAMNPTVQGKVIDTAGKVDSLKLLDADVDYIVSAQWDNISNADLLTSFGEGV